MYPVALRLLQPRGISSTWFSSSPLELAGASWSARKLPMALEELELGTKEVRRASLPACQLVSHV